jgi:putative colanic acid biosynthesis acetyltransferase WcaF
MRLDKYTLGTYSPGASLSKQLLWYFIGAPLVESYWLPISSFKVWVLRLFGAKIGGVKVKFPWRLTVFDYVWIGENAWIDNSRASNHKKSYQHSKCGIFKVDTHNWMLSTSIALRKLTLGDVISYFIFGGRHDYSRC